MSPTPDDLRAALKENAVKPKPLPLTRLAESLGVKVGRLQAIKSYAQKKEGIGGKADPTSFEGRLRLFSQLALDASDGVRLKALETLEEVTKQLGQGVGPGAPLTREERVERLAVILQSCEPDEIKEALKQCSSSS